MPVQIDNKALLTPREAREKLGISESKLRRLSQLGIIPSIPTGSRGGKSERGPELRLYDEAVLDQLDSAIKREIPSGVKPAGQEHHYYSRRRRKTSE